MTSNREKVETVSIEIIFGSADVTRTGFCCLFLFPFSPKRNEKLRNDSIQIRLFELFFFIFYQHLNDFEFNIAFN